MSPTSTSYSLWNCSLTEFAVADNFGPEDSLARGSVELEPVADADFLAGADQRVPVPCWIGASQHDFDEAGGVLFAARVGAAGV